MLAEALLSPAIPPKVNASQSAAKPAILTVQSLISPFLVVIPRFTAVIPPNTTVCKPEIV